MRSRLGNLDNIQFGMGLQATPGQSIPAKNASLGNFGDEPSKNKTLTIILGVLILWVLINRL